MQEAMGKNIEVPLRFLGWEARFQVAPLIEIWMQERHTQEEKMSLACDMQYWSYLWDIQVMSKGMRASGSRWTQDIWVGSTDGGHLV